MKFEAGDAMALAGPARGSQPPPDVTGEHRRIAVNSWLPRPIDTLVIDADDAIGARVEGHLAEMGHGTFRVTRVDNLQRALELMAGRTFSLALVNVELPNPAGVDAVTTLADKQAKVPLVVYGDAAHRDEVERSLSHGAQDHVITDNMDTDRLTRAVRYAMDRKRFETRLEHLAHYDSLTGLANRGLFHDRVGHALSKARRNKTQLAVLLLDLDRFKNVNDSLGHMAGDMLLSEVASRLNSTLRTSDTVARLDGPYGTLARLGGDEFAVLIEDTQDETAPARVAARMLAALSESIELGEETITITASIGIAVFPGDADSANGLLKCADLAMYQAKGRGRQNYQLFNTQLQSSALGRIRGEHMLRHALERGEFVVHYQPQQDLKSERFVGMEALVRWQRGDTLVPPGEFIGLLEDTGLIVDVGEWVLRESCRELAAADGHGPDYVAVNLSARQFEQDTLVKQVQSALDESGLRPDQLELEITESVLMRDQDQAVGMLHELKQIGVRLALDDFGTGYSSLACLKNYPVDVLKIDQAFIRDIAQGGNDAALAAAIIQMGHTLNLKVLAEAVETTEQLDFLKSQGCDMAQGFLLARPVPFAEAFPRTA